MRISGIEPALVILGQTKFFLKLKNYVTNVRKQGEAKKGW